MSASECTTSPGRGALWGRVDPRSQPAVEDLDQIVERALSPARDVEGPADRIRGVDREQVGLHDVVDVG